MVWLLAAHTYARACLWGRLLLLARRTRSPVVRMVGVDGAHACTGLRGATPWVQVGVVARLSSGQYSGVMGGRYNAHTSLTHARHDVLPPTAGASAH